MSLSNENFAGFWKDKLLINLLGIDVVLNIVFWIFLGIKVSPSEELISLHYNVIFGIDVVGEWYKIFVLPGIGLAVIAANFFLAYLIARRELLASYLLGFVALVVQIVLLVGGLLIWYANI
ncbi:MAG: hypothetical protein ACD_63C00176G0002 [uncultured bacterium]|nr:MAG: hypothetical protein ACD_63C00176G0002 [uncultured bacterium]